MATTVNRPNSQYWVQFRYAGKKQTCRLGKTTKKVADEFKRNVEELLVTAVPGVRPSPEIVVWLQRMGDGPHRTLAGAGLAEPRQTAGEKDLEVAKAAIEAIENAPKTVGDVTAIAIKHIKESLADGELSAATLRNATRATDGLLRFWGTDFPIDRIKTHITDRQQGDRSRTVQEFRRWLLKEGRHNGKKLKKSTVNRRLRRCREFFGHAIEQGWLAKNPFQGFKIGTEVADGRSVYVPVEWVESGIDSTYDVELRLLMAYSRYCGIRGESEVKHVRLDDFNLERRKILIRSPKTERYEGHESRWMPLWPALERRFIDLMEKIRVGEEMAFPRYGKMSGAGMTNACNTALKNAGVASWPRYFVNCRASCEEDLLEVHPIRKVVTWIGHSAKVAQKHYDRAEQRWDGDIDAPVPQWCQFPFPPRRAENRVASLVPK